MNEHACFCLFVRGSVLGRKFSPARGVCSVFVHEVVNNETTNEHDKHKIPEARLGYCRKKKADCHAEVILREVSTRLNEPLILKIARNGSFETKCHVFVLFMFVCVFVIKQSISQSENRLQSQEQIICL